MDFFVAKTRSDSKDPCQGTPSSRQQPLRKSPGEDCKIPTRGTPVARGRQSIDCNYVEEANKCEISNHAPVKSLLSSHHTFHDPRLGVTLPSLQHSYQADDRRFWKTAFVLEKHSVHFREKHSQYRGGLLAGNTGPHQTQRKEKKKNKEPLGSTEATGRWPGLCHQQAALLVQAGRNLLQARTVSFSFANSIDQQQVVGPLVWLRRRFAF